MVTLATSLRTNQTAAPESPRLVLLRRTEACRLATPRNRPGFWITLLRALSALSV